MAKKVKTEAEASAPAAEVPTVKEARAAHKDNSARFVLAVAAEKAASRGAESGDQMQRLAAFRALKELDEAEAANAETAVGVEKAIKKHGPDSK